MFLLQRSTRAHFPPTMVLVSVFLLSLLSFFPAASAWEDGPEVGTFFEYRLHTHVGNGGGAYEEYTDNTDSQGRYEFLVLEPDLASVHATYSWTYRSSEGDRDSGRQDRIAAFNLPNRTYRGPRTDLDDYDDQEATSLSVWFWVPPNLQVLQSIDILDQRFTVVSRDATVWVLGLPRHAMELTSTGSFFRDDAYGQFTATWTDDYWFDLETGMFLRERYVEHDSGHWQGQAADFTLTSDVELTASSYEAPVHVVELAVFLSEVGGTLAFFTYAGYRLRWASRSTALQSKKYGGRAKVRRIKSADQIPLPAADKEQGLHPGDNRWVLEAEGITKSFRPFLWNLARKGLMAGDRVAVATNSEGLHGLGIYSKDAKIATLFAEDTGVAETLRRFLGAKDFFSEWRHQVPKKILAMARSYGTRMHDGDAYNLFETYKVLELDSFPDAPWDTGLVRPMTRDDLGTVAAIAKKVYKVRSKRFVRSQFDAGDLGFVAHVDGQIVGFAFATLEGAVGRLHMLTVLKDFRNRGIGRELLRARLAALRDLGARRAITEIAEWNLASLTLAQGHGFRPVGKMYVETARTKRVKRNIVRR